MNIIELTTKNFKALGSREFNFTSGLNLVLGENGKGKTTLFRAIGVALYGSSALPGVADNIASWGETSWSIELSFQHKGSLYVAKRSKSSASIHKYAELVASGHTPCTSYVQDLLALDSKEFDLFIHSKQDETDYILNYGATALQRKVELFSGVDVIERLHKRAREENNLAVNIAENTEVPEDRSTELKESVIEVRESEIKVQTLEKESLTIKVLEKPGMSVREANNNLNAYQKYLLDFSNYDKLCIQYSKDVEELECELSRIPELEIPCLGALETEARLLRNQKKDYERYEAEVNLLKARLDSVEGDEHLQADFEEIWEEEKETYEDELSKLNFEQGKVSLLYSEKKTELNHLLSHLEEGQCKSCGTVLSGDLDEVKEKLKGVEVEVMGAEEHLKDLTEKKDSLASSLRVSKEEYEKHKAAYLRNVSREAQRRSLLEQLEQPALEPFDNAKLEKVEKQLISLEATEEKAKGVLRERKRLQSKLNSLEKPMLVEPVAKFTEEMVHKVMEEWEKYAASVQRAETIEESLASARRNLEIVQKLSESIQKSQDKRNETLKTVHDAAKRADLMKRLASFLKERRETYLKEIWDTVLATASHIVSEYTEGWITELAVTEGKFIFMENGVWAPTVEASGAQKSFIGAALRQALKKCLYDSSTFMLFDEPTGAMSETRSRQLMDSLSNASEQVFVITHRQTDSNLADNIISI